MNKYKAFYKNKSTDVEAETSMKARDKAQVFFKAKHGCDVTVILCEKAGETVFINPSMLPGS